ncbi:MAG: F0F1 ATP synthase subunit A, partial [Phycisphaeraceae bacterium]|nr:F0F1 ATP synthase subunit A [Phycisphaeraceae bacterium]
VVNAILTLLIMIPAARKIATGKNRTVDDFRSQGLMSNLVESVCVYLREDVFRDVLKEQTDRFCPILWTFFWYILICNLVGLIPILDITALMGINHGHGIGGTATQSIWVTGALSVTAFLFYNITAFFKSPKSYLLHLTGNAPIFMWPIMIPVEIMGTLIKPFALAIRLFANMTGGHLVIAVLLSFIGPLFDALGTGAGGAVSAIAVVGVVGINMLEVLVAFIQAYIFTFLVCLFLGQLVVHEHEENHEEDETDSQAVAAH